VKPITFLGDSVARIRDFPDDARSEMGFQLNEVQQGNEPTDWKSMKTVGAGVREIRVREPSGAFRVIYLATLGRSRSGAACVSKEDAADAAAGYRTGRETPG
jgi:phage-related protein